MKTSTAPRTYGHDDPAFLITYRSTVDNAEHTTRVRAVGLDAARAEFVMRSALGATVLSVRAA